MENDNIEDFDIKIMICVEENDFHQLKSEQKFFNDVKSGLKTFEIRINDRNFKVGDIIELRLYDIDKKIYLGDSIFIQITYILEGCLFIKENYCIFSFKKIYGFIYLY